MRSFEAWTGILLAGLLLSGGMVAAMQGAATTTDGAMPRYDGEGNLLLPDDYKEWRFVGSSLGLSYTEGPPGGEMFHHTLMEPTAYDHFTRTGEFREGTMFVLLLHGTGEGEIPQRRGRFAAELHGIEMAVKDRAHLAEGWGYYNFGGMNSIRDRARAMPASACYGCHRDNARRDHVFTQFYPLLESVAPEGAPTASESASAGSMASPSASAALALRGLDPVMLVEGREERGKPEIEMVHEGYRYQFVSEPTRAQFAYDPERYSIQNDSCIVVPGAPLDPSLFAVHEGRIYGFATDGCVARFKANPGSYLGLPR
jgi:YHS domain-containing protein